MIKLTFIIMVISIPILGLAQDNNDLVLPKNLEAKVSQNSADKSKTTEGYFNKYWAICQKDSAFYTVYQIQDDTTRKSGIVKIFWHDLPLITTEYSDLDNKIISVKKNYYPTGELKSVENYFDGNLNGDFTTYYWTGHTKSYAKYKRNVLIDEKFYLESDIDPFPIYNRVKDMPEFPGGQKAIFQFLANSARYPKDAAENRISGKVYVTFIIDEEGEVINPSFNLRVHPFLDAEAYRLIHAMPNWIPGKIDGKAVRVRYTVPISFILENGGKFEKYKRKSLNETDSKYDFKVVSVIKNETSLQVANESSNQGKVEEPHPNISEGIKPNVDKSMTTRGYFNKNYELCGKDSAVFVAYQIQADTTLKSGIIKMFSMMNLPISSTEYSDLKNKIISVKESYYPSGELKSVANYSNGKLNGDFTIYYQTGQTKRIAKYEDNVLVYENSFWEADSNWNEAYILVKEMPIFPGGEKALKHYLESAVKYPIEARKQVISGRVYIAFVVDEEGKIWDEHATSGTHPLLDPEALRVVREMPNWIPGKQNGRNVKVRITVPVDFILK